MSADPGEIAKALAPVRQAPRPVEIVEAKQSAEKAKAQATELMNLTSLEVTKAFKEAFDIGPEKLGVQEWIRIGEIILSRSIPKVAAKHVEEQSEVIDSADVASIRESIVAEFKKRGIDVTRR